MAGLQQGFVDPTAGLRRGITGLQETIKQERADQAATAKADRETALASVGLAIEAFKAGAPGVANGILEGNEHLINKHVGDIGASFQDLSANLPGLAALDDQVRDALLLDPIPDNQGKIIDAYQSVQKMMLNPNNTAAFNTSLGKTGSQILKHLESVLTDTELEDQKRIATAQAQAQKDVTDVPSADADRKSLDSLALKVSQIKQARKSNNSQALQIIFGDFANTTDEAEDITLERMAVSAEEIGGAQGVALAQDIRSLKGGLTPSERGEPTDILTGQSVGEPASFEQEQPAAQPANTIEQQAQDILNRIKGTR